MRIIGFRPRQLGTITALGLGLLIATPTFAQQTSPSSITQDREDKTSDDRSSNDDQKSSTAKAAIATTPAARTTLDNTNQDNTANRAGQQINGQSQMNPQQVQQQFGQNQAPLGWQQQTWQGQPNHGQSAQFGQQQQPFGQQQYGQHQQFPQPSYGNSADYKINSLDPRNQGYGHNASQQWSNQQQFNPNAQQQSGLNQQQANSNNAQGQQPSLGVTLAAHSTHGVVVTGVSHQTPAEVAGLQAGDQIVAVNGQHIFSNQDLVRAIHSVNPQQGPLALTVLRNGQQGIIHAALTPPMQPGMNAPMNHPAGYRERPALGVTLNQNGPDDVRIASVIPGGPAQQAGLQPGDRILGLAGQRVTQTNDVIHLLAQAQHDQRLPIHVERNGQEGTLWALPHDSAEVFQGSNQ